MRMLLILLFVLHGCGQEVVDDALDYGSADTSDDFSRYLNDPPEGFSDLKEAVPGIMFDIRYHGTDNFTGAPLPGYGAPGAWMLTEAAEALNRAQQELSEEGLSLLVYDAYRPHRATLSMVAWAHRTERADLIGPYIADRSSHGLGYAVDLTLARSSDGEPLDMGAPFDTFDSSSHTENASGTVLENRLYLKSVMERQGFANYSAEWWHYSYRIPGAERRDVPYSCFEAAEDEWTEPSGWDEPGYEMPLSFDPPPACTPDFEEFVCFVESSDGFMNVRDRSSSSGRILGEVFNGEPVVRRGIEGSWSRVKAHLGGQLVGTSTSSEPSAFIHSNGLRCETTSDDVTLCHIDSADGYMNVRSRPNGRLLGQAHNDTVLIRTGVEGSWSRVQVRVDSVLQGTPSSPEPNAFIHSGGLHCGTE